MKKLHQLRCFTLPGMTQKMAKSAAARVAALSEAHIINLELPGPLEKCLIMSGVKF